jgi:hypothetical protein
MARPLRLDAFCYKQFERDSGDIFIDFDRDEFTEKVNEFYSPENLRPGYAEFCKHLFIPNFTPATVCSLEIKPENECLLRTGYETRREEELAVLSRWFNASELPEIPVAKYLDIILYSRDQINIENAAMGAAPVTEEYEYGIICAKP